MDPIASDLLRSRKVKLLLCANHRRVLFTLSAADATDATDLGYLLHKHPARHQSFELSVGTAEVFYPVATPERCTVAMLMQVDPVGLVRRVGHSLDRYVNDRPYVASSFFSVALGTVFKEALLAKCNRRPELVQKPMELTARLAVVHCVSGEAFLRSLFEPMGYLVSVQAHPLDSELGFNEEFYFTLELRKHCPVHELLNHIYVLMPVLDNQKHYYVGDEELEKLLRKGADWLPTHPLREVIVRRYLKHQRQLTSDALGRLEDPEDEQPEAPTRLHDLRLDEVVRILKESGARRVLDLGCGSGKLLRLLVKFRVFEEIVGMDVSLVSLQIARERLDWQEGDVRLKLIHGSLLYRDRRLEGFDAAAVVEVVEHLDPPRLAAFERTLFQSARPRLVVLTTPNSDYNALFPSLPAGKLRHADHRFEWTRSEFAAWSDRVAETHGYRVERLPLGPEDPELGSPSQMALFQL